MAVLDRDNKVDSTSGFAKEIDEGAKDLIIDTVQANQYQYPIKSTVRELASNALDSLNEKQNAYNILTGKSKVEDYYITRASDADDPMYKDSSFDPGYFSLDHLNMEDNLVHITYYEGKNDEKDRIEILDFGVGLGGKRLEGYFRLGYSTKRNSHNPLGKFGIGAKAAFSTGVSSYVMETCYNGALFKFEVYAHKIDSLVPSFNVETREDNTPYQFGNGFTCYYQKSRCHNYVKVAVECKKHLREKYIDAVKTQLGYFPNIDFKVVDEKGYEKKISTRYEVLYEDDTIVLSNNKIFNKPHFVINGVNYGYIDFLMMELEDLDGNIGIKVDASQVDVNPSRESIRWTDKTRNTVLETFRKVVDIASRHVDKQLKDRDIIEWAHKCRSVIYSADKESVLGRLSRVIDKTSIKPKFPADPSIQFKSAFSELFEGFDVKYVTKTREKGQTRAKREEVTNWDSFHKVDIHLLDEGQRADFVKDIYLTEQAYGRGHLLIRRAELVGFKDLTERKELQDKIWDYLQKSSATRWYGETVVPKEDAERIREREEEEKEEYEDPVARRKREQKIPISAVAQYGSMHKGEVQIQELDNIPDGAMLCWGNQEDLDLLKFMANLYDKYSYKDGKSHYNLYNYVQVDRFLADHQDWLARPNDKSQPVMFIRIAVDNVKYFQRFPYVRDEVVQFRDGRVSVNKLLRKSFNKSLLEKHSNKHHLFRLAHSNFQYIDTETHAKALELNKFMAHKEDFPDSSVVGIELHEFCKKLAKLQLGMHNGEDMAETSKELLGVEVEEVDIIDMDQYISLVELIGYIEPIEKILKYNTVFTDSSIKLNAADNEDLLADLRAFFRMKRIID